MTELLPAGDGLGPAKVKPHRSDAAIAERCVAGELPAAALGAAHEQNGNR